MVAARLFRREVVNMAILKDVRRNTRRGLIVRVNQLPRRVTYCQERREM